MGLLSNLGFGVSSKLWLNGFYVYYSDFFFFFAALGQRWWQLWVVTDVTIFELGAQHLPISIPKLRTCALVKDQSFHEECYIYAS